MNKLEKAQLIMLDILKLVDKICKENNICYWLDSGTLLGAVRHEGFIPWDDDLDIGMLKEDYKKFIEIFPKYKNKEYFLLSKKMHRNYNKNFIKVMSKKYFLTEAEKQPWPNGIYIDIFPFEKFNNSKEHKKIAQILTLKKNKLLCIESIKTLKIIFKNIFRLMRFLICLFIPIELIIKKIQNKEQQGIKSYIGYDLMTGFSFKIKKDCVFPLKKIKFEDGEFFVPSNYDEYLKKMYGNYMKLPPKNKRMTHAIKIEIDENKFREEFINENIDIS